MADSRVSVKPVLWESGSLYLLDQTRLPFQVVMERQDSVQQVWESIRALKVRGAPAIGVATAFGMLVGLNGLLSESQAGLIEELKRRAMYLESSRPTAVNLSRAARRMVRKGESTAALTTKEWYGALLEEAIRIYEEEQRMSRRIGENGRSLIHEGCGVLTHCNAGRLAAPPFGTATAPLYLAYEEGIHFRVFVDETRPLLQGARLTSWELHTRGIDVTLITDNMAADIMAEGHVDLVIVGADRVAANGDAANKIGTLGVAILAKHYGIPFYVACPGSTVDLSLPDGTRIPIEERSGSEVTSFGARPTAPEGVKTRNPAFDVTPNSLISGIITEAALILPPFKEKLQRFYGSGDVRPLPEVSGGQL